MLNFFLMIIINFQNLYYFLAKIKYCQFLIYFKFVINKKKHIFNRFKQITRKNKIFTFFKTIKINIILNKKLLFLKFYK